MLTLTSSETITFFEPTKVIPTLDENLIQKNYTTHAHNVATNQLTVLNHRADSNPLNISTSPSLTVTVFIVLQRTDSDNLHSLAPRATDSDNIHSLTPRARNHC